MAPLSPIMTDQSRWLPFRTTGEIKTSTATVGKMHTTNLHQLQQCPPTHNRASNMNSTPPRLASSRQYIYSEAQIMDIASPYKLGQSAQDQDMLRFTSIEEAHSIIPTLLIGTPLFVKRSDRSWTYARIVSYHRPDIFNGYDSEFWNECKEDFVVVVLDENHSMRKYIPKEKWHSCVRLLSLAGRREKYNGMFVLSM